MNIAQLRTFILATRLGSVRQAAIQLGISQPAGSARIRELEEHLGIAMLHRDSRPIRVTSQGYEIFRIAVRIVELVAEMEEFVSALHPVYGSVRLGATHAAAATWLPNMLKALYEQLPGVDVELTVELTDQLITMLRGGELDVAFVVNRVDDKAIGYRKLYEMGLEWVVSRRTQHVPAVITPQWIARSPILADSVGSPVHRAVLNWFRAANVQPRRIDVCSGPQSRLELSANGDWITILPSTVFASHPLASEFMVVPSLPPLESMEVGVAYRLASEVEPTVQRLIHLSRDVIDDWHSHGGLSRRSK